MTLVGLDDLDMRIIHALQSDARRSSSRDIAAAASVSPSTVRKRIRRLEDDGVITGYRTTVDYERAGYHLHVRIVCTASIADSDDLADRGLAVPGVVSARTLATGERNVVFTAVGADGDDLTRIAADLSALGLTVVDEELVRRDRIAPFVGFASDESRPGRPPEP